MSARSDPSQSSRQVARLWHDDIRRPPDDSWFWARTNRDAIAWLLTNECAEASLDHDMGLHEMSPDQIIYDLSKIPTPPHALKGASEEGDGVDLVQAMMLLRVVPPKITIHSWNAAGASHMASLLRYMPERFGATEVMVKPFEAPDGH